MSESKEKEPKPSFEDDPFSGLDPSIPVVPLSPMGSDTGPPPSTFTSLAHTADIKPETASTLAPTTLDPTLTISPPEEEKRKRKRKEQETNSTIEYTGYIIPALSCVSILSLHSTTQKKFFNVLCFTKKRSPFEGPIYIPIKQIQSDKEFKHFKNSLIYINKKNEKLKNAPYPELIKSEHWIKMTNTHILKKYLVDPKTKQKREKCLEKIYFTNPSQHQDKPIATDKLCDLQKICHESSNLLGKLKEIQATHPKTRGNKLRSQIPELQIKLDQIIEDPLSISQPLQTSSTSYKKNLFFISSTASTQSVTTTDSKFQLITTPLLPSGIFVLNCLNQKGNNHLNIVCIVDDLKQKIHIIENQSALVFEEDLLHFKNLLNTLVVPGEKPNISNKEIDGESNIVLENFCLVPIQAREIKGFLVSKQCSLIYPSNEDCIDASFSRITKQYLARNSNYFNILPENSPDTPQYLLEIQSALDDLIMTSIIKKADTFKAIMNAKRSAAISSSTSTSMSSSTSSNFSTSLSFFSTSTGPLTPLVPQTPGPQLAYTPASLLTPDTRLFEMPPPDDYKDPFSS
ncbi:MAG: hypothetical protein QM752_07470 [Gammaproteobacteria bacterium]